MAMGSTLLEQKQSGGDEHAERRFIAIIRFYLCSGDHFAVLFFTFFNKEFHLLC